MYSNQIQEQKFFSEIKSIALQVEKCHHRWTYQETGEPFPCPQMNWNRLRKSWGHSFMLVASPNPWKRRWWNKNGHYERKEMLWKKWLTNRKKIFFSSERKYPSVCTISFSLGYCRSSALEVGLPWKIRSQPVPNCPAVLDPRKQTGTLPEVLVLWH